MVVKASLCHKDMLGSLSCWNQAGTKLEHVPDERRRRSGVIKFMVSLPHTLPTFCVMVFLGGSVGLRFSYDYGYHECYCIFDFVVIKC